MCSRFIDVSLTCPKQTNTQTATFFSYDPPYHQGNRRVHSKWPKVLKYKSSLLVGRLSTNETSAAEMGFEFGFRTIYIL